VDKATATHYPDGYILRLNPPGESNLGYTRDELKAKRFFDFVNPDDVGANSEGHDHEDVAVINEPTPQPGGAVNLHAMPSVGHRLNERANAGRCEILRITHIYGPHYACLSKIRAVCDN